ncbi:hypothetical protein C8T65DRAFT_19371 [Cerioporus squamosus]|nr:hypothetical protein C8T65DRAFT_19371 [Cerioporus squamosus]
MSVFQLQYEISDVRSEPVSVPRLNSPRPQPLPFKTTSTTTTTHAGTPRTHERSAGKISEGTMPDNHPIVTQYVERTAHALQLAEAAHAAVPENAPWHVKTGHHVSWWRAEKGGFLQAGEGWEACRRHVEEVFNLQPGEWSLAMIKAVFALGALSTFAFPGDTAFWAFWGKTSWTTTANLVDEVVSECSFSRCTRSVADWGAVSQTRDHHSLQCQEQHHGWTESSPCGL